MRYWTLQAKQFYEAAKRAEETTKELLDEEVRKEGLERKARKAQLPHSELALRLETEGKAAPARASHREDWRLRTAIKMSNGLTQTGRGTCTIRVPWENWFRGWSHSVLPSVLESRWFMWPPC